MICESRILTPCNFLGPANAGRDPVKLPQLEKWKISRELGSDLCCPQPAQTGCEQLNSPPINWLPDHNWRAG